MVRIFLRARPTEVHQWSSWFSAGKSCRRLGGNSGIVRTRQRKAWHVSEDFGAFIITKFAAQKKGFMPTSFCRRAPVTNLYEFKWLVGLISIQILSMPRNPILGLLSCTTLSSISAEVEAAWHPLQALEVQPLSVPILRVALCGATATCTPPPPAAEVPNRNRRASLLGIATLLGIANGGVQGGGLRQKLASWV